MNILKKIDVLWGLLITVILSIIVSLIISLTYIKYIRNNCIEDVRKKNPSIKIEELKSLSTYKLKILRRAYSIDKKISIEKLKKLNELQEDALLEEIKKQEELEAKKLLKEN